jgi:hypothetical protein
MNIFEDVSSTNWWLSVVVVGIVINLLSSWIGGRLAQWRAKVSEKYRNSKSAEADRIRDRVNRLKGDPALREAFYRRLLSRKISMLESILLAIFFMLLGIQLAGKAPIFSLISSICFMAGNVIFMVSLGIGVKNMKNSDILEEAEPK